MIDCHHAALTRDRLPTCSDIAGIRPFVLEWLRHESELVVGAGAIVRPGLLADQPRRLEWWSYPERGSVPVFLEVDLDPDSLDFYDYAGAEWFCLPERTGRRHITGPHVDFGGTDRYILTFTLPVFSEGRFLGVVGADVPAARLESRLLPVLIGMDHEAALLNTELRVIASNSPRQLSGALFSGPAGSEHTLPGSPWRLFCVQGPALRTARPASAPEPT